MIPDIDMERAGKAGMKKQTGKRQKAAERKELLLCEDSPFTVTEAYKALRTNIIFSLPGSDCKCIAVTSSTRSEGKSTNSVNLALSFGQLGKKVLIIDADMRLPTIANMLDVNGKPGLSDLLVGGAKFGEACTRLSDYEIDVIPAGTIPPDPTRLLESAQMAQLLEAQKESYDYIIIDCPPVNTVTDALILSKSVDGYLLLVKHNFTEHKEISEMVDHLKKVDGKILGFLYVDADIERKGYYKKYGYGQGKK